MLELDCHELTLDEQLALASSISDSLAGRALALVSDSKIVFDTLSGSTLRPDEVETALRAFISRRKDAALYSVEGNGETLTVHSPDPLARGHGRKEGQLPGNLLMCPFCPFITQYQETYNIHVRSHGFAFPW